ncbi:Elongin-C OS=Schizosaccharomyces pombe (strain 972 / ATCC 24843) GN=elc1 PE=3 SV=1 [Rhizoctonia solani AG-1 IB]|uniref:Elongin-C n=1 Tax=Thanatephorus cucumeris (strain AG1-IB / isolate 7/3/14) TaxID=1108050 RepID=A0A0B7FU24_THACB|nr:Elongin-C OS=Schizosaccharomyces pombe (strain 972 / ATCC 24843) GN=elc1 PE=3 SV=1 [Rhizoctonia solani AG-1 IB]
MTDQEIVWVRITSEDGFSFLLDKRAVECSGTLRDMVDDSLGFTEAHSKTISLAYRAAVVEKVVEYLNFRYLFKDTTKTQDIPDFSKRIPPEIVLEVTTPPGPV